MTINRNKVYIVKKFSLTLTATFLLCLKSSAQLPDNYKAEVEIQAIGTTNNVIPFWMRSNQFGSIPLSEASSSIIGRIKKNYSELMPNGEFSSSEKLTDWAFGFEGRANVGNKSNSKIIEAYIKARLSVFEIKAGRSKDLMGLNGNSNLSSGNFTQSGNALGIPKLEISIPQYWRIPILDGLISIKGNFAHGWSGRKDVKQFISQVIQSPVNEVGTYLHQKSFYGRLGKENWNLKLYGGFNHQVFWGGEKEVYKEYYTLSPIETFIHVATGKAYGNGYQIPSSKIGNQIGSIDIGAEYKINNVTFMLYRQTFYDVGALSKLANIKDGINGITITNLKEDENNFMWKSFLFEFIYTKNQAGELTSKYTKSGDEDYYNNYFYPEGWSYRGLAIGNPLLSTKTSVKEGQASDPNDYFINNRVIAVHLGMNAKLFEWQLTSKLSFSKNYGTYGTSSIGHSLGSERFPPKFGLFTPVNQFSALIGAEKEIRNKITIGSVIGFDKGELLNNSLGALIKVSKAF